MGGWPLVEVQPYFTNQSSNDSAMFPMSKANDCNKRFYISVINPSFYVLDFSTSITKKTRDF